MTDTKLVSEDRRKLMKAAVAGAGAAALFGGLGVNPFMSAALAEAAGRSEKPLKAAFSNAGLQATWCAQGKQAAEYWGKLFNVDVTWFDGQLDAVKQRAAIDNMASHDAYGTPRELFGEFFRTIADTLSELLGDDWSPEMGQAWRNFLGEIDQLIAQVA